MRHYSHLHETSIHRKKKREKTSWSKSLWMWRISVTQGVGLDSSPRKSNLIFPLIDSGTWFTAWISLGWKTEDFLIWIPPLASHVPCRDKKEGGNAKRRKRNSARGRRKLSEASRLNYLSRGPIFLDLLFLIRSPPWKRRKFHFVAQRGGCSKGGEARDSSRSAFNWWLFLRGGSS